MKQDKDNFSTKIVKYWPIKTNEQLVLRKVLVFHLIPHFIVVEKRDIK